MDIAKHFKPEKILLWKKIENDQEALRIIGLFPKVPVQIIDSQQLPQSCKSDLPDMLIKSKRLLMLGHSSNFIGNFDGNLGENLRCCPYHKLVPASNGCPYYCTYCYLAFVYRKFGAFIKLNLNYDLMFKQIEKVAGQSLFKLHFNMGEMLDSLAMDHITNLTLKLIPFFKKRQNAYLMLLTKSSNIDNLIKLKPAGNIVLSWSLNAESNIKAFEPGTATLRQRLTAARICQQLGYRIRFRIDPGIMSNNWQNDYELLIEQIFKFTEPENITTGMLRLLPGHINLIKKAYINRGEKLSNLKLNTKHSDDKLRFENTARIKFYNFIFEKVNSFNTQTSLGLCRESNEIWQQVGHRYQQNQCNCITW